MNEYTLNQMQEHLNESLRAYNNGGDCDLFLDEWIDDDTVSITCHQHFMGYINEDIAFYRELYNRMIAILFDTYDINHVYSPMGDRHR